MNEGGSDETLLSCPSVISRGSIETAGRIELVSGMQSNPTVLGLHKNWSIFKHRYAYSSLLISIYIHLYSHQTGSNINNHNNRKLNYKHSADFLAFCHHSVSTVASVVN